MLAEVSEQTQEREEEATWIDKDLEEMGVDRARVEEKVGVHASLIPLAELYKGIRRYR